MAATNVLRRTFCPSKEEEIELIELHRKHIGDCSTCLSHIPTDAPGFVTDYGDCLVKSPIFLHKVCGMTEEGCPLYTENAIALEMLLTKLRELKG